MVILVDWSSLIFAILTSSVIGAIVSNLFSEWQKRNEYKRDYYKKIIDKRMKAYESVELFASCFDKIAITEDTGQRFLDCCWRIEESKKTFEILGEVQKQRLWLEKDCRLLLDNFQKNMLPFFAFAPENEINQGNKRIIEAEKIRPILEKDRDELRNIIKKKHC